MHLNYLCDVGLDSLARNISLGASVVFNDVGAIAVTGHFLCGGGGGKYGFKGLPTKHELS
jgi:hypothetical protein